VTHPIKIKTSLQPGASSGGIRLNEVGPVQLLIRLCLLTFAAASAAVHAEPDTDGRILEKAARLKAGQYIWELRATSVGPVSLVIDLSAQRIVLYRDDVPSAVSTISTGRAGRETPTGLFTILEKQVVHRSRTYDDASMPYMQRLTWKGVSMHAGHLPGYPASHGCIRLPMACAKLLFGVTKLGTSVRITESEQVSAPASDMQK